jgi:hypothetical protein
VRYRALPSTARATPGWFREVPSCSLDRTDWLTRKVAKVAGDEQQGCGQREHGGLGPQHRQPPRDRDHAGPDHAGGVLAGDQEHAQDANRDLCQLDAGEPIAVGSKLAISAGVRGGLVTLTREYSTPKPTMSATAVSSDHAADGWVRNFVHSERATFAWVTWARVVIGLLPWSWVRGTPPHPGWRS